MEDNIRHKVFISYWHEDQAVVDDFIYTFDKERRVFISRVVGGAMASDVEINSNNTEYVMRRIRQLYFEVGWEKRTPKSGKIERRRCQNERDSTRKVHEGVSRGSGENGNGREAIVTGGSPSAVLAAIDVSDLGEGI